MGQTADNKPQDLKTILTEIVGKLIEPSDIVLDNVTKAALAPLSDKEKEEFLLKKRNSLIEDAVLVITPVIQADAAKLPEPKFDPILFSDPHPVAIDISKTLIKPKRGKEDLNTPEGRVAQAIREKANDGLILKTTDDEIIINGFAGSEGLIQKLTKILNKGTRDKIYQAYAIEKSTEQLKEAGVNPSFEQSLAAALGRGITTLGKALPDPTEEPSANIGNGLKAIFTKPNQAQASTSGNEKPRTVH